MGLGRQSEESRLADQLLRRLAVAWIGARKLSCSAVAASTGQGAWIWGNTS